MAFNKFANKTAKEEEEDSNWDDEEEQSNAPKILCVCRVVRDHIPETNKLLTLIQDDLVYVFKKNPDGMWEGETKGVYGKFPKEYVVEAKP